MKNLIFIILFLFVVGFNQANNSLVFLVNDSIKKDSLYKEISFNVSLRNPKIDSCMFDYLISTSSLFKYPRIFRSKIVPVPIIPTLSIISS